MKHDLREAVAMADQDQLKADALRGKAEVTTAAVELAKDARGANLLTNSRMACLRTCPRKAWFRYEIGLRRKQTAKPLRMGRAIHLGIELQSQGASSDEAIERATADYVEIPAWCSAAEDIEAWTTEREIVARLLCGYFWRWQSDGLEHIASEISFELPIINPETGKPTPTFNVAGKIDAIVRLSDGRIAVKETKTVGEDISPASDYWLRLSMDQQISLYIKSARRAGHDAQTVLYDAIRKPGIKPRKLTKAEAQMFASTGDWFGERMKAAVVERETPQMFGARLNADIAERPDFYFARREIPRLDADLAMFDQELWDQQKDLRERQKTERWYRNTSACRMMGTCEYLHICPTWSVSQDTPTGFEIVDELHPELVNGDNNDDSNSTD